MDWVKRNLYFTVGSAIALVLMGLAGWYGYTGWRHKEEVFGTLSKQYAELKRLYELNPNPGTPAGSETNNIQAAKDQTKQLRDFISQTQKYFEPIAPLPPFEGTNRVTSEEFTTTLRRTVDLLQRDATNASVGLPPKYNFSFEAQKSLMTFDKNSLNALAVQLGEIKVICEAVFGAKVNALDAIRRERVSTDDNKGPPSDYLAATTVTNELAVITPYEVTFRCFSAELAGVLNRLHSDEHCLLVKTINVEPAPAGGVMDPNAPTETPSAMPMPSYYPVPTYPGAQGYMSPELSRRYGMQRYGAPGAGGEGSSRYGGRMEGGGAAAPGAIPYRPLAQPGGAYPGAALPYAAAPVAPGASAAPAGAAPARSGPQTVLNEKPLRVTVLIHVVKLLPKETNR